MKELLAKVILGWIVTMLILYCIILPDSINPFFGDNNKKPYKYVQYQSSDGDKVIIQFDTKEEWLEYVSFGDTTTFWIPVKYLTKK